MISSTSLSSTVPSLEGIGGTETAQQEAMFQGRSITQVPADPISSALLQEQRTLIEDQTATLLEFLSASNNQLEQFVQEMKGHDFEPQGEKLEQLSQQAIEAIRILEGVQNAFSNRDRPATHVIQALSCSCEVMKHFAVGLAKAGATAGAGAVAGAILGMCYGAGGTIGGMVGGAIGGTAAGNYAGTYIGTTLGGAVAGAITIPIAAGMSEQDIFSNANPLLTSVAAAAGAEVGLTGLSFPYSQHQLRSLVALGTSQRPIPNGPHVDLLFGIAGGAVGGITGGAAAGAVVGGIAFGVAGAISGFSGRRLFDNNPMNHFPSTPPIVVAYHGTREAIQQVGKSRSNQQLALKEVQKAEKSIKKILEFLEKGIRETPEPVENLNGKLGALMSYKSALDEEDKQKRESNRIDTKSFVRRPY